MPELIWDGKNVESNVPVRALDFDAALSCGDGDNLIVRGDNLAAMTSLVRFFRGRVKCIYIDPPYNTGAAFEHYNDNFEHDLWLSMMSTRLKLMKQLLSDDGSIWISIDDDEAHYLKVICDEIFGRNNFVGNAVWHKKGTRSNDARWFSDNHDFILVYALDKEHFRMNLLPRTEGSLKNYSNPDNDPRGVWQSLPLQAKSGSASTANFVHVFSNGVKWSPPQGRFPAFSHESLDALERDNRIWFGAKGTNVPRYKKFLSDVKDGFVPTTLWLRDEVGDNQEAKREVKALGLVFDTPKPERLIERVLTLATNAGDLVMDCFLGSGTTAAVAHKLNRRYIGVEIGDHATTHVVPRLRQVVGTHGGGFKFCRLGEEVFDAAGNFNHALTFETLARFIWFGLTGQVLVDENEFPMLGIVDGAAVYLLDDLLTRETFAKLPTYNGRKIVYAAACRLSDRFLRDNEIEFRHVPNDLRT